MSNQSILIIDDELLILDTMSKDLSDQGYNVDTAENGEDGIIKFCKTNHNLVIIDLVMEGLSGIQTAKEIKDLKPETKVIFLTGYGTRSNAIEALRLGASDFFLKPYNRSRLLQKISLCLDEQGTLLQSISKPLLDKIYSGSLSRKEKEVIALVMNGLSDKEISLKLFISVNTVKTHLKSIYAKLELKGRKQLLTFL
tara:strand:- start:143 stop:733 length:591 start_codon:yes stop_codon:yes gene_type:complete